MPRNPHLNYLATQTSEERGAIARGAREKRETQSPYLGLMKPSDGETEHEFTGMSTYFMEKGGWEKIPPVPADPGTVGTPRKPHQPPEPVSHERGALQPRA